MERDAKTLAEMIEKAGRIVFFGGAGVSTASGVPDFRGAHGLYGDAHGRGYEEMLSRRYFDAHTDDFWTFYQAVLLHPEAKPNPAHLALARLERQGKLAAVITQNIDGLHQAAGSERVLELHGTAQSNTCLRCGQKYGMPYVLASKGTPHCAREACGGALRPDIVLYGEPLNQAVLAAAVEAVRGCDLLIVGGTSLVVQPAAGLVNERPRGAALALINREETPCDELAQFLSRGAIAQLLDEAVAKG